MIPSRVSSEYEQHRIAERNGECQSARILGEDAIDEREGERESDGVIDSVSEVVGNSSELIRNMKSVG